MLLMQIKIWSLRLACSSPDPEPERETPYQNSVFDWLPVHPAESSITRRGSDFQQHQTGAVPAWEQNICDPPVDPFSLWCWKQWGSRPVVKNGRQVGAICTPHVLQRSKDHTKKQLQDWLATTPRNWDRRGQHPPAEQSSWSQNL